MGSKGQTSTTSQNQTYSPAGGNWIQQALQRAQGAASNPFAIPQAPVAGFSPDQQAAFGTVNRAQGMAQPYYDQANQYFGRSAQGPDVSKFFNPYAGAVASNMEDLFGQQRSQNTGDLTQAAGGVGADRIAVGQGELAKQQGQAFGQTMANVYAPSLSAALQEQNVQQGAGYGTAMLGSQAENSAFRGAHEQLGTGGLQQQLSQAQLNSPYQLALAQAAFPYQQSNFFSGAVGSLAPGLGGTTTGQGTTTTPGPSLFSQLLGLGTAGVGAAGGMGAFNGNKGASYGGGSPWSGDAYGGSSSNPLSGLSPGDYGPGYARGGTIDLTRRHDGSYGDAHPYACGGATDDGQVTVTGRPVPNPGSQPSFGGAPPPGASDPQPSAVPTPPQMQDPGPSQWADPGQAKLTSYAPSLSPPQQAGFGSPAFNPPQPGGFGNKGSGSGHSYDSGGSVSDEPIDIAAHSIIPEGKIPAIKPNIPQLNLTPPQKSGGSSSGGPSIGDAVKIAAMFMKKGGRIDPKKFDGYNPYFAAGGSPDDDDSPASFDERFPYRAPSAGAQDDWRSGADSAMAFAGDDTAPRAVTRAARAVPTPSDSQDVNPHSPATAGPAEGGSKRDPGFAGSPWAAVMAAGLGMAAGKSPFALTNIGTGGLEGLKTLESQRAASQKDETIDQAARRLQQEADFHQDKYTKMTPYEKGYLDLDRQKSALEAGKPFKIGMDKDGFDIMGVRDPKHPGHFINALTGESVDPATLRSAAPDNTPKTLLASADGIIPANAQLVSGGAYDYTRDAPYTEKGMDVPEPAGVAGRSPRSVQTDAEYYLQTGKLPPVRGGKSPVAVAQQNYRNAVQNYAGALGQSRGITPEQSADMWRTAPGMLRFILGADGRSTVALGTAVRHLDTLKQFSDAWKSGDVQTVNRLRATISREFGSEAATNLEAAGRIVGPEIIKAIGVAGAGTAEERLAAEKGFGTAASPEQINGAIRVTQSLLGGQLEGRKRQANNAGVSDERFKSLVGERPYEVLTGIDKGAKNTATPAAETAPAVGTLKQFKQGMGRWNGTAWEPVQ